MWWVYLITAVHILACLFLILVVLLQTGKGADIAAAFSGQGSQTAFGPRGAATALTRATTWAAIVFMLTSLTLSIAASRRTGAGQSVLGNRPAQTQPQQANPNQQTPAQSPAPTAPAQQQP